ncbi:MAG: hydrogenase expression/formation protein HypE [Candidatus Marinimicrobia bacterium CG08_land_8_20_14_0_20_45_22]|nr:MAG: hydrogenase expression/formation protein HypE [Candidatus Marinimicrobia bacterium CG08_land_8_20_14_0_20_45_22]
MSEVTGKIVKAHGSGGKLTHELIHSLFVKHFSNHLLDELLDSAILENPGGKIVFTTDSHAVKPLFFPGGDIGKLSVTGTVNDLAVCGATPLYLSCAMILEEGFELDTLEKIVISMKNTADLAGVQIVTGDTKVVEHGAADGIFINTAGIGVQHSKARLSLKSVQVGDVIIVSGWMGDHEAAIIKAREEFNISAEIISDCALISRLTQKMVDEITDLRIMRDPTRGGLATTLNEFVWKQPFGIRIDENLVPVRESVRGLCEPLGFDPLYLANEGKVVAIVGGKSAGNALSIMKSFSEDNSATVIGEVIDEPKGKVLLKTGIGSYRILDMLTTEQLPRIC